MYSCDDKLKTSAQKIINKVNTTINKNMKNTITGLDTVGNTITNNTKNTISSLYHEFSVEPPPEPQEKIINESNGVGTGVVVTGGGFRTVRASRRLKKHKRSHKAKRTGKGKKTKKHGKRRASKTRKH